jgi:hypothetical protein
MTWMSNFYDNLNRNEMTRMNEIVSISRFSYEKITIMKRKEKDFSHSFFILRKVKERPKSIFYFVECKKHLNDDSINFHNDETQKKNQEKKR